MELYIELSKAEDTALLLFSYAFRNWKGYFFAHFQFDKGGMESVGFQLSSMETRVAMIGIIVENMDSIEQLNEILHQYGRYIIGRMGIPYEKKKINIISIAVDAPEDIISALSGKIGRLSGVSSKTAYSKV